MERIQKSVYQVPQDLKLAVLIAGQLPILTVLRSHQLSHQQWTFTFSIIGESHFVSIAYAGKPILHEILACVPIESSQCHYLHDFMQSRHSAWQNTQYGVEVRFHEELPPPIEGITEQIVLQFPEVHGQLPITQIGWRFDGDRLQWWTLHTYPNEIAMTYVVSQSFFQCTPEVS